jgi:hypothetical protein
LTSAERQYKNRHGRYGDLAALRKAHLLSDLGFESCSSVRTSKAQANFVPKSTVINVAIRTDGQQFDVSIVEHSGHCGFPMLPDLEDNPEGPILPVAG